VPSETTHHITLSGAGLSLDKEISEDLANRITMLVLSGGKSETPDAGKGPEAKASLGVTGSSSAKNKSIREYLLETKATKIPQQITAIGHHLLEAESGKANFSMAELIKGFGDAKETAPSNPHRDVGRAIKSGWIAPRTGEKDAYYVTGTGLTAIENRFPKTKRKRRRKKKASTSKAK
jgi:hypothetical protein